MSDAMLEGLTELRDLLLAQSLPDELIERINKITSKKLNPKKMSKKDLQEIQGIIAELKKHDALALIGLE